ncbi:hypothetical protein B0H13DRAFT_2302120 [Mycena leptocephala]|nr:hypothetical protein B0H13DRAFT_2302120 [Mycena leptocephala]
MSLSLSTPISLPWTYVPDCLGPVITPLRNGFSVTRAAGVKGWNKWTSLSLPNVKITNGWTLEFDLKYNQISVRQSNTISSRRSFFATIRSSTNSNTRTTTMTFILIADSNIAINDYISHHVALNLQPTGVQVVEDGVVKGFWSSNTAGSFEVKMDWQILDVGAALQAEVTGILASRTVSVGQTH